MNLPAFRTLLTPAGQEALAATEALTPREADFLAHFQTLSKRYPPDLARAALETAILRREAGAKFPHATRMYFTRESLEQATPAEVSAYRAERYREFDQIADLGCSIGGDTLALAQDALQRNRSGRLVTGLDLDPLRLHLARANAQALALADHTTFLQADLTHPLPFSPFHPLPSSPYPLFSPSPLRPHTPTPLALFFDPARRTDHRRAFSVRDYAPPLNILRTWRTRFPALGVKISPGVDLDELTEYDCEIEFISLNGELKEACLWFGPLKTGERRATILPGAFTLMGVGRRTPEFSLAPLSGPLAFLYEPDPAILRARLVTTLAEQLHAFQLDPAIAYLTSAELVQTPFARAWPIEAWMPFNLKKLRAYLRERNVGRVTVKKRGSPLEPESLIYALKLKGDEETVLVLTKRQGEPIVLICAPQRAS
ncbi:MAG: methyltransferase domain-containing protein [Anaerolineales bacterium]